MQLSQSVRLKQKQSMVMTPRLQQAIRMLQMNNLDLTTYLETQALENPFMEVGAGETAYDVEGNGNPAPEQVTGKTAEGADNAMENGVAQSDTPTAGQEVNQYESAEPEFPMRKDQVSGGQDQDWDMIATRISERPVSLAAHLQNQIDLSDLTAGQKIMAHILLEYLEPSGWMPKPLAEIAEEKNLDIEAITPILAIMQSFEPSGIFARNLSECLRFQAMDQQLLTPQFEIFLNHLELLAAGRLETLKRKCKCDDSELADMVRIIRGFDPKPGAAFDQLDHVVNPPDLIVTMVEGNWVVELNKSTLPGIVIDENYAEELTKKIKDKKAQEFTNNAISSARWFKRAMEQRNNTTLTISAEIIKQQTEFLEKGLSHLKPLLLRDVAKAVSMHESTVSRVTSGILIATPMGSFPLKSFFSVSLSSHDDTHENASAAAVRNMIQELVSKENPQSPMSDDAIAAEVSDKGIQLARRTVAKYRQLLKIPSSTERRRRAKLSGIC